MKKKRVFAGLGCICLVLILVVTFVMPANAKPIELKLAHYSSHGHPMLEGIARPWAKMVEEKTNGKVKITIYPAQTLVKMRDTYDAVVSGIADIAWGLTLVTPGRFVLSNVITIPFSPWTSSSELASQVVQKLYEDGKVAKEWSEVKLLFMHTTPPSTIFSSKPVRSYEDAKKTRLITHLHTAEGVGLQKIGFIPVAVPTPEVYLSLQRGVADATMLTWESCAGRKIYEVTKYAIDPHITTVPFYYIMNKKRWNSLPPDVKKAIDSLSGMWGSKFAGKRVDASNEDAKHNFVGPKLKEIIKLSPGELKRWQNAGEAAREWWIKYVEKKGKPGRKIYEEAVRITNELK
ncbi:TRAP transporter substrate-binding protein [Thermodesulfobacteriota bacterium]